VRASRPERGSDGRLRVGGCDVVALAEAHGTPLQLFDVGALRERARAIRAAMAAALPGREAVVAFASKACPLPPVLRVLAGEGLHCDVASSGELALALAGGFAGPQLVLHGNAKRDEDMRAALDAGIGLVVVDGPDDVDRLELLGARGQPVLLRVTPGVEADTHAAIRTGHAGSKFGVPLDRARELLERLSASPAVALRGLHVHLGSQILDTATFAAGIRALGPLPRFDTLDVGGGLGIAYRPDEEAPSLEAWAGAVAGAVEELGPGVRTVMVEPGRSLVGPCATTLYRVVTVKRFGERATVAVDGGLSDNLEPLYGIRFDALHADRAGGSEPCRLVGLHCEEGDTLADAVMLDDPRPGDLLAVPVTGAYTYSLANNYNGIPRAAVVLCDDGDARLVVRRETTDDLLSRLV
jgi:diaminopimelate decarboxylase